MQRIGFPRYALISPLPLLLSRRRGTFIFFSPPSFPLSTRMREARSHGAKPFFSSPYGRGISADPSSSFFPPPRRIDTDNVVDCLSSIWPAVPVIFSLPFRRKEKRVLPLPIRSWPDPRTGPCSSFSNRLDVSLPSSPERVGLLFFLFLHPPRRHRDIQRRRRRTIPPLHSPLFQSGREREGDDFLFPLPPPPRLASKATATTSLFPASRFLCPFFLPAKSKGPFSLPFLFQLQGGLSVGPLR